jgi:hypothetical protein
VGLEDKESYVRSHAKASTAGSTQRQAQGLGRFFRGALATRGASSDARGGGAPKSKRLALPIALLVAVFSLTLGVASALAVAPTIVSTSVSAVTTKAALLEASINPEGEATTYRFEYGPTDCSSSSCASTTGGNVGAGSSAAKVTKEIAGLSPGTTYHFRVLASNASGTTPGPDRSFTTYATVALDTSCPNQAFRVGPGAILPDCRGYEMVSPVDKNGGDIFTAFGSRNSYNQSSVDGDKLTYTADAIFGDQPAGRNASQYMATRGAGGWTSHGINAPRGKTLKPSEEFYTFYGDLWGQFHLFSPDLSEALVTDYNREPLTPDASPGWVNLYRRDNLSDSYEALTRTTLSPPSFQEYYRFPEVAAASSDAKHVVLTVSAAMTPDANPGTEFQTYYYSGGELHLVSVLPDGSVHPYSSGPGFLSGHFDGGGVAGNKFGGMASHAISDDGSRIFWTASPSFAGFAGAIYVRENPGQPQSALTGGDECTEPAKACTRLVAAGSNYFWAASADGSKVLYGQGVSEDNETLKEFDVDAETTTTIAGEAGGVAGASDDLSYVYFTSKEALDAGATAGEWNLYVDHEGAIGFIATISPLDAFSSGFPADDFAGSGGINANLALNHAARVTPDGRHLAFMSDRSLSGYDNTDALSGEADREVYLYDAGSDQLTCVSCNPSGARPVGHRMYESYTAVVPANETEVWAAAWLQTWVHNLYHSHALSDDGNRLYFNSFDALVPQDTNGAQDVYQWEAQGTGNCQKAGGCVSLISTGQSAKRSEFVDATPNGSDVFFETSSSIDPRDPGLIDIYDARAGGGFPIPAAPEECFGDACQSAPEPPRDPTPASASFKGAGNPAPASKRRACKARKRHAAKGKHHAKQSKAKRCTRANRRAGR